MNSTVYGNTSGTDVGAAAGIKNSGYVYNCISWGHESEDYHSLHDSTVIANSCFKEATSENGNTNSDPLFVNVSGDASTWNFQLQSGSPLYR